MMTPNPTPTANAGIAALAPKATPQQVPQQAGGTGDIAKVQAELRSLPASDPRTMQILTSYANGANPMVPQFLALGEIKRREQMQQQMPQPPQGTVKDKLEQSANTMAMQQAKQQQAMQAMAGQAMQAPGPVPQGTPQPAVNMADGGVVALPVRNEMFNYASGGIVAFADPDGKQLTGDSTKKETSDPDKINGIKYDTDRYLPSRAHPNKPAAGDETMQSIIDAVGGFLSNLTNPDAELARNRGLKTTPTVVETPVAANNYDAATQDKGAAELAALRDAMGAQQTGAPAAPSAPRPPAASGAPRPAAVRPAIQGGISDLMPMSPEDRRAKMMQNPEIAEALKGKAGEGMAAVLDTLAKNDALSKDRFKQQEDRNQLDAVSKMLIAAGRGTAGRKGFGQFTGALGGAGESLIGSNAAATERADKREALEREQTLNMGKLREEITAKRRAEAEGRIGDMEKHDQKIAELKVKLSEGAADRANRLAAASIGAGSHQDPRLAAAVAAVKGDQMIDTWQKSIAELNKVPTASNKVKVQQLEGQITKRQNDIYKAMQVPLPDITMGAAPGASSAGGKAKFLGFE